MDEYKQKIKAWEHHLNLLQLQDKRVLKEASKRECPECESQRFQFDEKNYYLYCHGCGLVLSALYPYTGGLRLDLPLGLL